MAQFHKVLVATDFSECARPAVKTALGLAKAWRAAVVLLHVVEEPADYKLHGLSAALIEEVRRDLRVGVERQLEGMVAELAAGQAVETRVRQGVPSQQILELAQQEHADLVVVGTRGLTGLKPLLLGSTAERVVRGAACAVLTVRLGGRDIA